MNNPLQYSTELLVKKALNIPAYVPQTSGQAQTLNPDQIPGLLDNVASYPAAQQDKMYGAINKGFSEGSAASGIIPNFLNRQMLRFHRVGDTLGSAANYLTNNLWGSKYFDTDETRRYAANIALQHAAQDPNAFQALNQRMSALGLGGQQPASPAAGASPMRDRNQAALQGAQPTGGTPQTSAAPPSLPQTPAPSLAPVAPNLMYDIQQANGSQGISAALPQAQPPAPAPTPVAPPAAQQVAAAPQANPTPWNDPTAKFNPQWTPAQREQYIRNKYQSPAPAAPQRTALNPYSGKPYG